MLSTEVMTQMSTQNVDLFVEQFAKLFVHYQQAMTSTDVDVVFDGTLDSPDVPSAERERVVAAARLALMELEADDREKSRRWYARPGQAEWGC